MSTAADFNVSLEPHLVEALEPLIPVLPEDLSAKLANALRTAQHAPSSPPPLAEDGTLSASDSGLSTGLISYPLLSAVSTWTRSADGRKALATRSNPPLEPGAYSMVALLAGTRTSPEKSFPNVPRPLDRTAETKREMNDRRAITAVLNALLSVIGAGVATWWAADRLRWRDEWKALLALSVAIVVAASEAILYIIWESRRSKSKSQLSKALKSRGPTALVTESVAADQPEEGSGGTERDTEPLNSSQVDNPVPPASSNVQEHRTTGGLRDRRGGSERKDRMQ